MTMEFKRASSILSWSSLTILSAATLITFLVGMASVGGWAWSTFGSASAALGYLRGESLLIEPAAFDLGLIRSIDQRALKLGLVNLTGQPINVYGLTSVCQQDGCIRSLDQFPLVIPARRRTELVIEYQNHDPRPALGGRPLRVATDIYTSFGLRAIVCSGFLDARSLSAR